MDHGTDTAAMDSAPAHADCSTCPNCQICHTVALASDLTAPAPLSLPAAAPVASLPAFTSALPVRGLKPPIS